MRSPSIDCGGQFLLARIAAVAVLLSVLTTITRVANNSVAIAVNVSAGIIPPIVNTTSAA